jgi:hypothetical protein
MTQPSTNSTLCLFVFAHFLDNPRETVTQQGQIVMERSELPPKSALTVPILEQEQQIDPWSVDAGKDSQGNALAFDYVAIAK